MTMFNTGDTWPQILAKAQTKLANIRSAMDDAADLQAWASGIAVADLTALSQPPTAADAGTFLSACADAGALSLIYDTGQAPPTYPQVPAVPGPYNYSASQRKIIGAN